MKLIQLPSGILMVELAQTACGDPESLQILVRQSPCLILISSLLCSLQIRYMFVESAVPRESLPQTNGLELINATLQQRGSIVKLFVLRLLAFPCSCCISRARLLERRFRGQNIGGSLQELGRHATCRTARALGIDGNSCLQLRA